MKRTYILLISLCCFSYTFAQLNIYLPNGSRLNTESKSIKGVLDSLGIVESEMYSHKLGMVFFKRLSNKPIFIEFPGKAYPSMIKEIIASYDYSGYLNSYSYYYDLKDMILKGSLTKEYLFDAFKEPDSKGKNEDSSYYWIYKNYNTKINFDGDSVKSADVVNYNAIIKNEIAVTSFEVTGGDYDIGFNIDLSNYSKKVIKYASITVKATNPVHDVVGIKTVKAVGPINPTQSGSYEFGSVIYTRTATTLHIENIKLEYMDKSTKIIPKSEINKIRIMDWEEVGKRSIDN